MKTEKRPSRRVSAVLASLLLAAALAAALCGAAYADETEAGEMIDSLFPRLKGYWVGDVMPMTSPDGKSLDLFYLFEKTNNGPSVMHPFHMLSTSDFTGFTNEGLFVEPTNDPASQDFLGLGTGCFYSEGDTMHCFYTGVNLSLPNTTAIMHAVSGDGGKTWTKLLDETIYPPDGYDRNDYRDAQIEYNEKTGEYMMLVGARTNTGRDWYGVVIYYTSTDLHNWTFRGNLFAPDRWYMCECPDIQKIGDKYYLFYSWDCVTYYAMADDIGGPYRVPSDNVLSGDGFTFYAGKAGELDGRYYLCAWLGRKLGAKDSENYEWGGNAVVFEIYRNDDGTLRLDAPHTYDGFFTKPYAFVPVGTTDGAAAGEGKVELTAGQDGPSFVDMGVLPRRMNMTCKLSVSSYFTQGGLVFGTRGVGEDSLYIMMNASKNRVEYNAKPVSDLSSFSDRQGSKVGFRFEPDTEYDLRVVVEDEIIAVYINGEKTLINRIYSAPGFDWGFFCSKNGIMFSDISITVTDDVDTVPGTSSTKVVPSPTPHTTTAKTVRPPETTEAAPGESTSAGTEDPGTLPSGGAGGKWLAPVIAGCCAVCAASALICVLSVRRRKKRGGNG